MPDLGTFTDTSSIVGEHAGSGRFTAASLKGYFLPLTGGTVTGPVTFGTGPGDPYTPMFQANYQEDLSRLPTERRQTVFNTTLTNANPSTVIWENFNSRVFVNGPGQASGEINALHGFVQVNAGATTVSGEAIESSVINSGTMTGNGYANYLALFNNYPSGVINVFSGVTAYLTNDNPAPNAVGVYAAFNVQGMGGSGSRPQYYLAFRNEDPNAGIATNGGIQVGFLGNALPGQVFIHGADNSGGTFPFVIQNLSGANIMLVDNAGRADFPLTGVALNPPGLGPALSIQGSDNSAGTFPVAVHNQSGTVCFSVNNSGFVGIGGGAGFFGAPGVPTKPTITGSRGGNLALAGLLTALANYGLLNDGTGA